MSGFAFDEHDHEWEHGDGLRTAYRTSDDFCDVCGDEIDFVANEADGECSCTG